VMSSTRKMERSSRIKNLWSR